MPIRRHLATLVLVAPLAGIGPLPAARMAMAQAPALTLTPVGAEQGADATGIIPAWLGGATSAAQAQSVAQELAAEKPSFTITHTTYPTYAGALPEGLKALLARDPDFRMDVYPTHRTAGYPPGIIAAIARNARSAHAVPAGCEYGIAGAAGGIPFPHPANGCQAVWNHLLAYWGAAHDAHLETYVVFGPGDIEETSERDEIADFPYYEASTPAAVGPYYFQRRDLFTYPASREGSGYITSQPIDISRTKFASWEYVPGERRVRRSPSLSYDTPNPDASGLESFDDYYVFSGGLDHYRYNLLGKREMYIPYNNHSFDVGARHLLGPHHADPGSIRYELHRVWVVDQMLAPGRDDVVPHRRLYLDEDTWLAVYADAWDAGGRLWKFSQGMMDFMPQIPAIILGSQLVYDLPYHAYLLDFSYSRPGGRFRLSAAHPASAFTPEGMAADLQR